MLGKKKIYSQYIKRIITIILNIYSFDTESLNTVANVLEIILVATAAHGMIINNLLQEGPIKNVLAFTSQVLHPAITYPRKGKIGQVRLKIYWHLPQFQQPQQYLKLHKCCTQPCITNRRKGKD